MKRIVPDNNIVKLAKTPDNQLEKITYNVPTMNTPGVGYETFPKALQVAIDRVKTAVERHNNWYGENNPRHHVPLPETITIDVRWSVRREDGVLLDEIAERFVIDNLAEAYVLLASHRAASGKEDFS